MPHRIRDARGPRLWRRAGRVLLAVSVCAATVLVLPQTAWSAPVTRLSTVSVAPGAPVRLAYPSSHLGVRWLGDDERDAVEVRWRSGDGPWQPWRAVEPSHDSGDERAGLVASGLLAANDATEVEVRVASGRPAHMQVVGIDTRHGPRRVVVQRPPAAGAETTAEGEAGNSVPQPDVVSRAGWGADESLRKGEPVFAPITRASVHHTAGDEGSDPAATVRAIYAYHTQSNGWDDIGYNFLIDSAGRIYEGRFARTYARGETPTGEDVDLNGVVGAHTAGNNTRTVGIAVLGDFTRSTPTDAALAALRRLLAWKADRHGIDPLGTTTWSTGQRSTIIGHRDAVATACPGDTLYDRLPELRRSVAATVGTARATVKRTTGYWLLSRNSALYTFGTARFLGGPFEVPAPVRSVASTPTGRGYWILSANGRVSSFGDAVTRGSTEGMRLNAPTVRLEPTPTGRGYWVLAADGGVFSFGDAAFHGSTGSMRLNAPVISMAATPSGKGYWLLAADGGVFTFGDARFHGSTGGMRLNAPVVSMTPHPTGAGYWLVARDGGVFSFGRVGFYGSLPGLGLSSLENVQMRATPSGRGYYVLSSEGGVFTFGDAPFWGANPAMRLDGGAVDIALDNNNSTSSS